ncbi:MAG TPA: circadian clock KaiB family protein [Pyrinomonadaceae bacterium]
MKKNGETLAEFERALAKLNWKKETFVLRLYVSGASPRSTEAIAKIKEICEEYLPGQYDLEVIDIYQQPELAREQQIIAAPTLIKESPGTLRRLIGSLSNTRLILQRLGIVS